MRNKGLPNVGAWVAGVTSISASNGLWSWLLKVPLWFNGHPGCRARLFGQEAQPRAAASRYQLGCPNHTYKSKVARMSRNTRHQAPNNYQEREEVLCQKGCSKVKPSHVSFNEYVQSIIHPLWSDQGSGNCPLLRHWEGVPSQ